MNDGAITDAFRYSNYIEGVVWLIVAGLAWKAARDRHRPRHGVVLLITFVLFGISDWVETTTGAWWRPWWLFAWKAACVVTVLGTVLHARQSRSGNSTGNPHPNKAG